MLSLSHALLYSIIVFKYVILIRQKEKYILGRIGLYLFGIWVEAELFLEIWGAKAKYFLEAEEIIFRDLWRSMYCFQSSREHRSLGASVRDSIQ